LKLLIDQGKSPETLLNTNNIYDTKVIGKFCEEKNDYELAYISYKKGQNDDELISLCAKHLLYKQLALYLVNRKNEEIWCKALSENSIRSHLIEQINSVLLNDHIEEDEIKICIKSFMDCNIFSELTTLLEKLIFYNKK